MGNNHAYKTVGLGDIKIRMHDGVVRTLTDVRHVPDLQKNLISVGASDSVGTNGSDGDPCEHTRLWHKGLGHISEKGLDLLGKEGLLKNMKKPYMDFYEDCVYGEVHRVQFLKSKHKSRGILDYVHTDI
ncbi:uncharacterized protein LOC109821325 [Asparagus officinalis]|uniref:uncharacterized protein LOC109821325 n=1 Tax=Asparagus officinalis TaxID=4686 RepID=UPI00098E524D|nr:uncharacterized protein LOC109821325 [Asparagus officinalis]